ncbi:MAG: flagellar basal body-associated FliL family protein [Anaeromyxobacter sp.]|nr:flagellar basal body-associated FliL family protein [Anaeromyxobacter sp.]MBL0276180.1 flagellar basal body-associated FliL family protein [Anaeromyxobacter sp.]
MAEETKEAPAPKAAGGSKIVPILLGVNMLLVVGVLALFMLKGGGGAPPAAAHGAEGAPAEGEKGAEGGSAAGPGPTTKMADFVVHLRDAEVDRYARISFEVELASDVEKAKFDKFSPRIRDGFIAYLSDRTLEELRGSEQVKKVKTSLQELFKELAPGVKVRALYITDLVIQ